MISYKSFRAPGVENVFEPKILEPSFSLKKQLSIFLNLKNIIYGQNPF